MKEFQMDLQKKEKWLCGNFGRVLGRQITVFANTVNK